MASKNVLVTGSAGYVGAALAQRLMETGANVTSVTRDRTRPVHGDSVVYGDVTDQSFCRRILADYEIQTIYHLAAQSIVSACAEDPVGALHVAVMGTSRLLQAVRESGRPIQVVVSTSDKVYGSAPSPYTEETPLDARHAYEVSKACQDLVARMFFHNYDLDVRVVRAVNIYGPGDPNESRLVPKTILRCLDGERPIVHAGAAEMMRQFVYIDDVVEALLAIHSDGAAGEAYCVGSPNDPMSVRDVIEQIQEACGVSVDPEVKIRDFRFREITKQWVDDRKLRSLGWTPKTEFQVGISQTITHYRQARLLG